MEGDRKIFYGFENKKRGLAVPELEKLLRKWQEKMGMADWKLDLKIVDFWRENGWRQSGGFEANSQKKIATIQLTWNPWCDEEHTLVHELVHVLINDYDKFSEDLILENHKKFGQNHELYLNKLEEFVDNVVAAFLGRRDEKHEKEAQAF